jgi:hypothetical protein
MASAVFNSSLTYLASGGGTLSQAFNLTGGYRAVSAGTIAVPDGAEGGTVIEIPFGEAGADCRAVFVRNETRGELGVRLNGAEQDLYRLGPGGVFLHWSPAGAGSAPLWRVALAVAPAGHEGGSIEFAVLGG